jgi:NAD+ synthase
MFNAEKETNKIVQFIRDYYEKNHLGGAVLGISGGKDSGVVVALFVIALGKENVVGITMPCHSVADDKNLAQVVADKYGFELINVDLTDTFDTFKGEINKLGEFTKDELKNSDINLKPRLRMSTCYYIAALYSVIKGKPYIVAGTSNKCELYVGYFTKGGDSVHDISPIADLTVDEVIAIGEYLGVPDEVLHRPPSDGLSGQTDEDKLGVKYKEIADYMIDPNLVEEGQRAKIKKLHDNNQHKFNIPTYRKGE